MAQSEATWTLAENFAAADAVAYLGQAAPDVKIAYAGAKAGLLQGGDLTLGNTGFASAVWQDDLLDLLANNAGAQDAIHISTRDHVVIAIAFFEQNQFSCAVDVRFSKHLPLSKLSTMIPHLHDSERRPIGRVEKVGRILVAVTSRLVGGVV